MIVYVEPNAENADHSLCSETFALLTRLSCILHHVVQKYYRRYLLK